MAKINTLWVVWLALAACGSDPQPVTWLVRFGDPQDESRAFAVETAILKGSCGNGTSIYSAEVRDGQPVSAPPRLGPGQYGLFARARDTSCQWFASGCIDVALPWNTGAPVEVFLRALAPTSACDAAVCQAGVCPATLGADGGACQAQETPMCDGDVLRSCNAGALQTESCILGCQGAPGSCVVPSNVGNELTLPTERGAWTIAAKETWTINPDTGEVLDDNDNTIRGPGEGVVDGVAFIKRPAPSGGAPLGVFVLDSLNVQEDAELRGQTGTSNALVLLAKTTVVIDGRVSVKASSSGPGPAGGRGGKQVNDGGETGGGLGGGKGGGNDNSDEGGGGGGSFGGPGGRGGAAKSSVRGAAGAVYGEPTLVPLLGGSGGGGAADDPSGNPSNGGHGGGAIQISAGQRITVGSNGKVEAGGSGGRGGTRQHSGGGGGSGGAILLEAPVVEILGKVGANGGAGGQGAPDSPTTAVGANGADGSSATVPAPGTGTAVTDGVSGSRNGGGGGRGNGASGSASSGGDEGNGGGGGGGGGRVRINTTSGSETFSGVTPQLGGVSSVGTLRKSPSR